MLGSVWPLSSRATVDWLLPIRAASSACERPARRRLFAAQAISNSGASGDQSRAVADAWLDIGIRANWRSPEDVKASYAKASILKTSRVVFNIKGNDYRLVARVQYQAGGLAIRFFGTHAEYDTIDAETA